MDKNNDILIDNMDERIESFLRGTMSAAEEAEFKREIKENPELRHRAQTMSSLIKGMHTHEGQKEKEITDSYQHVAATADIKNVASKRPISKSLLWWTCSIAAAFLIFFGIYRYNLSESTVSPYDTQYDIIDVTSNYTQNSISYNCSRGDLDSASVDHLYSLFTQIQEGRNITDAIEELESIYKSLDEDYTYYPFANDICWNLALAYIKDDQIDKATPLLEKLKRENPNTPIYTKADELLKKLKEL